MILIERTEVASPFYTLSAWVTIFIQQLHVDLFAQFHFVHLPSIKHDDEMAIIALENIHVYGKHGCYEAEAMLGGHYELDIFINTSIEKAAQSDDLDHTIDYEAVYNYCIDIFSTRHNLLETLVYKMATGLKEKYATAIGVRVKLSKLHPPLPGQVEKSTVDYSTPNF